MLEHGRVAVVVLGGAHDLNDNMERLAGDGGEYMLVTTKGYRAVVGCRTE